MNKFLAKSFQYLFLFLCGGSVYYIIEFIYKHIFSGGRTHFSMFVVGGIMLIIIGLINEIQTFKGLCLIKQMALSAAIITLAEYISGMIVNVYLGLGVWDYSNLPLNINGQICLPFTIIWFLFSIVPIVLDDFIREKIFKENKHSYKL